MQNSVESCYAGNIPTSTLQITNNKKIVVKGITGILSKMWERIRTEVATRAKTKESQYGLLFADY